MGCYDSDSDSSIISLNRSNFDNTIINCPFVVVKFYARYDHSEDFAPEYEKAAQLFKSTDPFVFAKVNAEKERDLSAKYGIWYYPTIAIFKDRGKKVEIYDGLHDAQGMTHCLKKLSSPFNVEFNCTPLVLDYSGYNRIMIMIVGVFPRLSGKEFDDFIRASEQLKWDYDFTLVQTKHLQFPILHFLLPGGYTFYASLPNQLSDLVKLIKDGTTPVVTDFDVHSPQLVANFFHGGIGNAKAMLFIDRQDPHAHAFEKKYHAVAMKYRGQGIKFMIGGLDTSQDAFLLFQLHKGGAPLIVIRDTLGENYLKANLESEEDIQAFVEAYKKGKLSQEKTGNVKEVVVQNFQEMVIDSGKNVFLEVGPWCQWCKHCKTLAPVLEDVATHYKKDDNIIIAKLYKIDNDVRQKGLYDDVLGAEDCPTLYFKRASGKYLRLYHGLRATKELIEFIEINRDVPLDKPLEIKSLGDITDLITSEKKIVIVGVFADFSGREYDNYIKAADILKSNYVLRIMKAKQLPKECGPVVRVLNPFENEKQFLVETKDFDVDALVGFVKEASLPVVTVYGEHPQLVVDNCMHTEWGKYTAMLFINRSDVDAPTFEAKYYLVASKYRGEGINFMLVDLKATKDVLQYADIEKSDKPFIVILNFHKDIYVKEDLKADDDIDALVKDYKDFLVSSLVEYFEKDLLPLHGEEFVLGEVENDKALLIINRSGKSVDSLKSNYMNVADNYKTWGIKFMLADFQDINRVFWHKKSNESVMVIMNSKRELFVRVILDSGDDIEAWVTDYKAGKLGKYVQSRRRGRVQACQAMGYLFEDDVMNSGRNVLVSLYGSNWINHTKFNSLLCDIAFHFKDVDSGLLIEKMRCDIVDDDPIVREALTPVLHRLRTLSKYDEPTLYLVGKHGEGVEVYDGDFTGKNIIDFVTASTRKSSWSFKLNKEHLSQYEHHIWL